MNDYEGKFVAPEEAGTAVRCGFGVAYGVSAGFRAL